MSYDADDDEILADLGAVPDSKLHAQVRRYGDSPPRLVLLVAGGKQNKLYPAKRLDLGDAQALGRFLTTDAVATTLAQLAEESGT